MAIGIYRAFKRRQEISSTEPAVFVNNIQAWLSIFAFSTFIVGFLVSDIEWLFAQKGVPLMLISGGLAIGGLFILAFIAIVLYAFIQLAKMLWRGWKGIPYEFDPNTTPINVLKAIRPVNIDTNLKEYKDILHRLIRDKSKLIEEQNRLIAEYSKIIQKVEKKDDKPKAG